MKLTNELLSSLQSEGYFDICEIPGKGICALFRFAFTTGLVYGMTRWEYVGRYCFETKEQAKISLKYWDGQGHPPGLWIKHKGYGIDELNPLLKKEVYDA